MKENVNEKILKLILKEDPKDRHELDSAKRKAAKETKLLLSNIDLLKTYHELVKKKRIKKNENIEKVFRTRPMRSLSGIVNISILTKPYDCPGECVFCPTQKDMPKSYLDNEPAVMRAVLCGFDPTKQIKTRITALKEMGHPVDKIELRLVGGTWSYYPKPYQTQFLKKCFDTCNGKVSSNLKEAQKRNETAKIKIIGIHVETRPDYVDNKEAKRLRDLGITGLELGVQTIYDDILKKTKRGHDIKETIRATKLLKDFGFKICYQLMPNLPFSSIKKDKDMFKEIFSNQNFQPDHIKIYPCVVLENSELYNWWKKGKHKSYNNKQTKELIKEIKKSIPLYVRIQRIIRDIPTPSIVAGPTVSNLRQKISEESEKEGWHCNCVRCREVKGSQNKEDIEMFRVEYDSSDGKEIFLSFENKERTNLYSLLRLRVPSAVFNKGEYPLPELKNAGLIREVHTYGQMSPVNTKDSKSYQHKGLGKKLIKEAENILKKEYNLKRVAVISGVGVRGYYRKQGYRLQGSYMTKSL
jgi:elongator complex protein 3